jgi:hypothetical protein
MMFDKTYTDAARAFPIPRSHEELEIEIRMIQDRHDPYMHRISDEGIQERIAKVYFRVVPQLTTIQGIMPNLRSTSITEVSLAVVQGQDASIEMEQRFPRVVADLCRSNVGRETMLRVLLSVSEQFSLSENLQPSFVQQNPWNEVIRAAFNVGAQPCHKELMQEEAYRDSLQHHCPGV